MEIRKRCHDAYGVIVTKTAGLFEHCGKTACLSEYGNASGPGSGRWGALLSEVKEEAEGRGTRAEQSAPSA